MERRNTLQRQIVLETVHKLHNHPTADDVYDALHLLHPTISKATVYRNLSLLAQSGSIRRVQVSDSADKFDDTLENHYHIKCNNCGAFKDLPQSLFINLDSSVATEAGYSNVQHDIVFYGTCPKCSGKH